MKTTIMFISICFAILDRIFGGSESNPSTTSAPPKKQATQTFFQNSKNSLNAPLRWTLKRPRSVRVEVSKTDSSLSPSETSDSDSWSIVSEAKKGKTSKRAKTKVSELRVGI